MDTTIERKKKKKHKYITSVQNNKRTQEFGDEWKVFEELFKRKTTPG